MTADKLCKDPFTEIRHGTIEEAEREWGMLTHDMLESRKKETAYLDLLLALWNDPDSAIGDDLINKLEQTLRIAGRLK